MTPEDFEGATPEQLEQLKKLERKVFGRSLWTGLRNATFLVMGGIGIALLEVFYVHNKYFALVGGIVNGFLFIRQIKSDIAVENEIIRSELEKIFKK